MEENYSGYKTYDNGQEDESFRHCKMLQLKNHMTTKTMDTLRRRFGIPGAATIVPGTLAIVHTYKTNGQ